MIDRDRLLRFCDGDETIAKGFLDLFHVEAEKALELLPEYLEEKEFKELGTLVHTLKSHLNYLGVDELEAQARRIEEACDIGSLPLIEAEVPVFHGRLQQLLDTHWPS